MSDGKGIMLMEHLNSLWQIMTAHSLFFAELVLAVIILVSLFFFRNLKQVQMPPQNEQRPSLHPLNNSSIIITSQDIRAIAGDDVLTTQLDLARAYIEIGKKRLAKKILDHVALHGNVNQKQVAHHLMTNL